MAQEAEDLDVEPDERHEKRERAVPLVLLRHAFADGLAYHLVVDEERQCRDADDDETDADADRAAVMNGEHDAEEPKDNLRRVQDEDAKERNHRDAHEFRIDRHDAARVDDARRDGDAERRHDGAHGDAGDHPLQHKGKAGEAHALQDRVERCEESRRLRAERDDACDDEGHDCRDAGRDGRRIAEVPRRDGRERDEHDEPDALSGDAAVGRRLAERAARYAVFESG